MWVLGQAAVNLALDTDLKEQRDLCPSFEDLYIIQVQTRGGGAGLEKPAPGKTFTHFDFFSLKKKKKSGLLSGAKFP